MASFLRLLLCLTLQLPAKVALLHLPLAVVPLWQAMVQWPQASQELLVLGMAVAVVVMVAAMWRKMWVAAVVVVAGVLLRVVVLPVLQELQVVPGLLQVTSPLSLKKITKPTKCRL